VLLVSGSQGEPMSALTRIARHDHPRVEIRPNDLVVLAATPVPGNEKTVASTVDDLYRSGARVVHPPLEEVHVSGHASQEELKMMINLVKPQYFIPVHGDYRNLVRHAQLANELGVSPDNTFVVENGAVLEFSSYHARIAGKVTAGSVFVDGRGVGEVGSVVLRDRTQLSQEGVVVICLTVTHDDGAVVAGPEVLTRGFVYVKESDALIRQLKDKLAAAVKGLPQDGRDWSAIRSLLRETATDFLFDAIEAPICGASFFKGASYSTAQKPFGGGGNLCILTPYGGKIHLGSLAVGIYSWQERKRLHLLQPHSSPAGQPGFDCLSRQENICHNE